jgi:hypothetical protein
VPEIWSEIGSGFKLGNVELDDGQWIETCANAGLPDE